jgi:hypothetical protein
MKQFLKFKSFVYEQLCLKDTQPIYICFDNDNLNVNC